MIRTGARRCILRRGPSTWRDANAQCCRISTTPPASAAQQRPRRPHLRQSYFGKGQVDTCGVSDEPAGQENDLPDEFDWSLDPYQLDPVEKQEARFERTETGRYRCWIRQMCPACGMRHNLHICPFVFEGHPSPVHKARDAARRFNQQMKNSQEFRDTVAYVRRMFVHRMPNGRHAVVPWSKTKDAPPLARSKKTSLREPFVYEINLDVTSIILIVTAWLQNFDMLVEFLGSKVITEDRWNWAKSPYSYFAGHYPTTDDDGRPFLIVFANSAHFDERMPYGMCFSDHFISRLAIFAPHMRTESVLPRGWPGAYAA